MITEIFEMNGDTVTGVAENITGHKLLAMIYQQIGSLRDELDKENAIIFVELSDGSIRIDASAELSVIVYEALE